MLNMRKTQTKIPLHEWYLSNSKVKRMLFQHSTASRNNQTFDYFMNMSVKIIASYER